MNALPASRLDWCEAMATYLTRSPWADAMNYLQDRAQGALDYLKRAAMDVPAPSTWLGWIRDKVTELKAALTAAKTDEARAAARKALKDQEEYGESYEAEYSRQVAEYRAGKVAKLIRHANRQLRVVERCKALINDDRGPSVLWIDPEVMFEMAYDADKTAKPGARWKVAGPLDEIPDLEHPEPSGPKPP